MKPTIDHSCSYHCDRPECIKAQRDEMRERLKLLDAQEPVAWSNEYLDVSWGKIAPGRDGPWEPLYTKPEAK